MPLILHLNSENHWLKGEGVIQDYFNNSNIEMDAHQVNSKVIQGKNPNIMESQMKFEPKNIQQTLF